MTIRVGSKVCFGRSRGEHTVGVVEKINGKSVKIRQTEPRGVHPVGTIWRVGPGLVWEAGQAAPVPKPVRRVWSGALPAGRKRLNVEIMDEIRSCYNRLSPENLWCDGEATRAQAHATARRLNARLKECFKELGRVVTEDEAWGRS